MAGIFDTMIKLRFR